MRQTTKKDKPKKKGKRRRVGERDIEQKRQDYGK